jgi:hypothetical protein
MCNEDERFKVIHDVLVYCSIPSGIACLFMIFAYLKVRVLQSFSLKIVFWMSVNDLVRNAFYVLPMKYLENENICVLYGVVINTALTNNAIWAVFIVISLYQVIFSYDRNVEVYFKYALLITFGVIPILNVLPIFTKSYGFNYGICTFKTDLGGIIWRSIQEGIIIITIIFSLVMYSVIYIKQRRFQMLTIKEVIFDKGMIFVIITSVTVTFLILFRYLEISYDICQIYEFGILSSSAVSLHGFLNFLAVMGNSSIRRAVTDSLHSRPSIDEKGLFEVITQN